MNASNRQKKLNTVKRRDLKSKNSSKNALYGISSKTPFQVQRRNERERRRVQAVNRGYEVLALQV